MVKELDRVFRKYGFARIDGKRFVVNSKGGLVKFTENNFYKLTNTVLNTRTNWLG